MAGGGGSTSGGSFTRTPDSLRSQDTVEVILGLCEGQIQGLVDGAKSFYIGDTPLVSPAGTLNFEDFDLTVHTGAAGGDTIKPQLGGTASNISVSTPLDKNVEVVRQLTVSAVTHIDIRLAVGSLYRQDDNGIYTAAMSFTLRLKKASDPSWNTPRYTKVFEIRGKTTSIYAKELRIPVPDVLDGSDFWQVQLTKVSDDSNGDSYASDVTWESLQQVIVGPVSYPGLATAHLLGRSSNQFSSIPAFWGIYKLRLVRVPMNYNPETKVYSGAWDGTFKWAWTDNPAWILYDFVTNEDFGLSYTRPLHMDKYAIYDAGRWCDTLVPDGQGGTEARYRFNYLIREPRPAWEQARFIAGTFNATIIDDGTGTMVLRMDDNRAASHMFTPEMVSAEGFQYSYTDENSRYNDIVVSFINPDLGWQEDRRRVFDQESIDTYGRVPYDFVATGCIYESEALRRAYYKLNTALTETELVSFKTNRLGMVVEPFDIILIADSTMGYGISGRVKSFTTNTVTLRDPVYLEFGVTYKITFRTPSGMVERGLTTPSTGETTSLSISPNLPADFPQYCSFIIEQDADEGLGAPKPYRVMNVEEVDGADGIQITAIEVNRTKFTDSENLVVSEPTDNDNLGDPRDIPSPLDVNFDEVYQVATGEVWTIVYPEFDPTYKYYSGEFEVWSRPIPADPEEERGAFEEQTVYYGNTLVNHRTGLHEFKILPKNFLGQTPHLGKVASFEHMVPEASEVGRPPLAPFDPVITPTPRGFIVSWSVPAADVNYIHHYRITEGVDEETATVLVDHLRDPVFAVDPMAKRSYNLFIYAVSLAGVVSETAANVSYTNAAPTPPTNFKAHVAYETISLTFDRNTEIDIIGYRIQYRKLGINEWSDMDPNGLFDAGEPNTAYEFRVAAIDMLTSILDDAVWSIPLSARTRNTLEVEEGLAEVRSATTPNLVRNGSFERNLTNWTVE